MAVSDFTGVIPPEMSTQIIAEATQQSAALQLGNRIPMGTTIQTMPVPKTFPKASFVSVGGRKPFTDLSMELETITAEEIAAVIAIPDAMVEDSRINLWNYARPLLSQAIALALDDAVFYGVGAPATFPTGGVSAVAATVTATEDAVETINMGMSKVETQGLAVTGHAADLAVRGELRGVRANTGELLLGQAQAEGYSQPTLYGLPISYVPFTSFATIDFFTGAWQYLVIGVRDDIRFDMNPAAVIADSAGKVVVSGWQDNTTPMKVWGRFGCVIVKPVTPRTPAGANPFAKAKLAGSTYVAPAAAEASSGGGHSRKG